MVGPPESAGKRSAPDGADLPRSVGPVRAAREPAPPSARPCRSRLASELPERLRVEEALRLYASFYRRPASPDALLEAVGLTTQPSAAYGSLSGGQKQPLSIALAFVGQPRAVVLDEPTAGLDPAGRREVWDLLARTRARGLTILFVTHDLEEAERLCDRVALISGGRLVALDTPAGLVARTCQRQRVRFRPSAPPSAALLAALGPGRRRSRSRRGPAVQALRPRARRS